MPLMPGLPRTGTDLGPARLADPDLHMNGGADEIFAQLRAQAPVCWADRPAGCGFWVVTSYEHAAQVLRDPQTYSSEQGMALDSNPASVEAARHKMLIVTDPPRHAKIRLLIKSAFTPRTVARLERTMRSTVVAMLDRALSDGGCDLVKLAARLPVSVICDLLGVPERDWDFMLERTQAAFGETGGTDPLLRAQAHANILAYYATLVAQRRKEPGDDLVSALVHGQVDGKPLTDEEVFLNCDGLVLGGNETTRHATVGGILALIDHPDQWALLRSASPGILGTAVNEILRWTSPGLHALRTPVTDTELGGHRITAGQPVTVWMASANKDQAAFPRAGSFDLTRTPNRHLTFGLGEHYCLGAALAQAELTVFFDELARRVGQAERAGPATRVRSSLVQGYQSAPAILHPAREAPARGATTQDRPRA